MDFGQIQKLRLVGVKNCRSCSTTTFGHLHAVKLTSLHYSHNLNILIFLFCLFFHSSHPDLKNLIVMCFLVYKVSKCKLSIQKLYEKFKVFSKNLGDTILKGNVSFIPG